MGWWLTTLIFSIVAMGIMLHDRYEEWREKKNRQRTPLERDEDAPPTIEGRT